MSNLLQLLQEVDPAISTSMAADLRAALAAVNHQVQVDPASSDWNLNSWWQWLEDEGYNRDTLLVSLQLLCASRLSAAALADLVAACHAHGDDPHGLEWVQMLIGDLDAELIELFHTLEAESLLEDLQLAQTAGGMSKTGKWVTGLTIGIGVPLGALLVYRAKKRGRSAEGLVSQSIEQTNAVVHQEVRLGDNMALNAAANDPTQFKAAAAYAYKDSLNKSKSLAMEHVAKFGIKDYEKVVREDVVKALCENPRSLEKVMHEYSLDGGYDYKDLNQVKVFLSTTKGEEYIKETVDFWKRMGWDRLTKEYFQLVEAEVNEAKAAEKAASERGDNLIEGARQLVKVDVNRDVGGIVGELNQAVGTELRLEEGEVERSVVQEEMVFVEIEDELITTA